MQVEEIAQGIGQFAVVEGMGGAVQHQVGRGEGVKPSPNWALEIRYVVSDQAKALIKLALTGLACPRVPDLFHALRDLTKVMGVSLSLKLAREHRLA